MAVAVLDNGDAAVHAGQSHLVGLRAIAESRINSEAMVSIRSLNSLI
jgi:hypothetical protein